MARIAVLCGTGMSAFASQLASAHGVAASTMRVDSEWGQVPATLVSIDEDEVLIIDRHHSDSDSRTPPHRIEHRANVHAAASGVRESLLEHVERALPDSDLRFDWSRGAGRSEAHRGAGLPKPWGRARNASRPRSSVLWNTTRPKLR